MKCMEVMQKINKYYDEKLSDIDIHKINKHLQKCSNCRNEYNEMKNIYRILSNHQIVNPPEDFTQNVMDRINKNNNVRLKTNPTMKNLGASLIAAGLIISIINFTNVNYDTNHFVSEITVKSTNINKEVMKPICKLKSTFGYLSESLVKRK